MNEVKPEQEIYGLMAEFAGANELVAAAKQVTAEGYIKTDAFTPYPLEDVIEALHIKRTRLPQLVFCGGTLGFLTGLGMQVYLSAVDYPINVGGRPYVSIPSFIPITFELTVLFAAITAVVGMIALNGLPMPYHPVFNVPRFETASRNGFFLLIEASDPLFDRAKTAGFLQSLGAREVTDVNP